MSNYTLSAYTGFSTAAVYDHLTSRRDDNASWFEKDDELYKFTHLGEKMVAEVTERNLKTSNE